MSDIEFVPVRAAVLTDVDYVVLDDPPRRRLAAESRLLRRELTLLRQLGAVPVPLQEFATPMTVN